jgi:hypothetical protein
VSIRLAAADDACQRIAPPGFISYKQMDFHGVVWAAGLLPLRGGGPLTRQVVALLHEAQRISQSKRALSAAFMLRALTT